MKFFVIFVCFVIYKIYNLLQEPSLMLRGSSPRLILDHLFDQEPIQLAFTWGFL